MVSPALRESLRSDRVRVDVTELERLVQLQVFVHDTDVFGRFVEGLLGQRPLLEPGWVSGSDPCVMNTGPESWQICASQHTDIAKKAEAANLRVVDIGHSRVVFRVSGKGAPALLSKGCSLDFSQAQFPASRCRSTLVGHFSCLIHRQSNPLEFDLYFPRSFADDAWEWFETEIVLAERMPLASIQWEGASTDPSKKDLS